MRQASDQHAVTGRGRRFARAGLVLALEAAAAFVLLTVILDAPGQTAAPSVLGAEIVAAQPERFRSRTVEIAGTVGRRPTRIRTRDEGTFVLLGERRTRLLVVPSDGATLTAFRAGTPVRVRGSVVIPPKRSRLMRRETSRTAIAERTRASALIEATDIAFLG